MKVLYDRKKQKIEIFRYKISKGGHLNLFKEVDVNLNDTSSWIVEIEFVDNVFHKTRIDMPEAFKDTRSYWRLMSAIDDEIKRIEDDNLKELYD